ncbi:SMI1/KNR4 family protein [Rummeliibacillus pycnus]|uniref:SMI1/KNR4 family protein n=1 Tax=Rummeliibacillus pycnus TaxID=101070 RepID=UPI003D29306B
MKYTNLQKFIKENGEGDDFTGGVNEERVLEIESKLQVTLPESYKWFLRNYGSGGIFGIDIQGYDYEGASVVDLTKDYREFYNLIDGIVVIENIDEFSYCLDTNKMIDGECPVIMWDNLEGYGRTLEDNFLDYFIQRLETAKGNWEEDDED